MISKSALSTIWKKLSAQANPLVEDMMSHQNGGYARESREQEVPDQNPGTGTVQPLPPGCEDV